MPRALMDPLSIATGTLTLLGALGTTVKGLKRLASLRDSPAQVLQLYNEVSAFLLRLCLEGLRCSQSRCLCLIAYVVVE